MSRRSRENVSEVVLPAIVQITRVWHQYGTDKNERTRRYHHMIAVFPRTWSLQPGQMSR